MINPLYIGMFMYLSDYIILHLKAIRTDKERDNDENYWMFTYDFKEKKMLILIENQRILLEKKIKRIS